MKVIINEIENYSQKIIFKKGKKLIKVIFVVLWMLLCSDDFRSVIAILQLFWFMKLNFRYTFI
jgi:hypothetical protein